MSTDTRLRGATRWSMAARCPRMAVFAFQGVDPVEPDEETRLRWERGKLDQEWVVTHKLAPTYGADNLVREKSVPWPTAGLPIGELHTDVFVAGEGLPVEVKSHFNGEVMDSDILQLAGEIHFDPDAGDVGALIVVDRNLHVDPIPVKLTDDLRQRVEETAAQVVAGTKGTLPERCCDKPADGYGRLCPFIRHCFGEDWQPPEPLDLSGEFAVLASELVHAEDGYRAQQAAAETAKERRDEIREQLREAGLEPGEYANDGIHIKLTHVRPRVTFRRELAVKAGIWTDIDEERFSPFVKVGEPSERWTVKRLGGTVLDPDDFGSDAPF